MSRGNLREERLGDQSILGIEGNDPIVRQALLSFVHPTSIS